MTGIAVGGRSLEDTSPNDTVISAEMMGVHGEAAWEKGEGWVSVSKSEAKHCPIEGNSNNFSKQTPNFSGLTK